MFCRFLDVFVAEAIVPEPRRTPRATRDQCIAAGWSELIEAHGGTSFRSGLYRLHDSPTGQRADRYIAARFPNGHHHLYAFGRDWMGRQFALGNQRLAQDGEPLVQLLDLVTGDRYEIDSTFREFHNVVLLEKTDSALDVVMFEAFSKANPASIPLALDQIVGYRIPLMLGGEHSVSNMEVADVEVEMELVLQAEAQLSNVEEGVRIEEVRIDR